MLSNRHQRILVPLVSSVAFILLLYLVFLYYSVGDRLWLFYNTDAVYLPYLYQDLILRDGKLSDWIFSPTPYFFPDTLIYFLLAALFNNLRLAIVLYAAVQFALYYGLIIAIGKKIIKQPHELSLLHVSVLFSLFLLSLGYLQQETLVMGLISQSHFGTALIYLLGLLLVLNTFSSKSIGNYFFLFVICFLTVFSDILYLTQFFAPAMITLFFMMCISTHPKTKMIYVKNMVVITVSCVGSYLFYRSHWLPIHLGSYTHSIKRVHLFELIPALKKITLNFWVFYHHNTLTFVCLSVYVALTLYYLVRKFPKGTSDSFIFTIIFLFASIVMGFLSLLFFDNNLMAEHYINLRHCIPFIIFPVFLGIPLYLIMHTRLAEVISTYYVYIILLMLSYGYIAAPKSSLSALLHFYPESTACLDGYANKYHLKNGLSYLFWETRSHTFLSKEHLTIFIISINEKTELLPRLYFTTLHDAKNKDFNFIIMGHDYFASAILQKFGTPLFTFTCPAWNHAINTVYVYPHGVLNKSWNNALYAQLLLKNNL